ncbi:helix-turn-helix domain-containing protein [Candidatus Marinarcus aquaticus]|uniref:Transcriptional regulator n=1 Tax=Candidatus Marinarcus aquaticus TaxID=2044504 RepID=A0A4Q0XUY7_9BACT|nr:helix-turn-helix transcriptional regulator [Candidatus Marinarcus aquaticus]RXJ59949.1 transcriptional regulator [Candidatus Marinarcus aquaticus]
MEVDFSNIDEEEITRFYRRISRNIKRVRLQKNMSQLDVALELGIKSVAFYSNCENLKYNKHFNLEHIYKIAKLFDMQPHEFLK